jgi:murein DD-endopeptidase MepM/ murein hydrolase activator NlpD
MMSRIGLPVILMLLLPVQSEVSASPALPLAQTVHVVQPGESVWIIARQHGLPPDLIVSANRLEAPDRLQIGDRLAVPAVARRGASAASRPSAALRQEDTHVVRPGETLWGVARRHGTSVNALARLNQLSDADRVQPGQKILLPAARAPPSRLRLQWRWPSRGVITSRFGFRGRHHHHGIDIAAPVGTPIFAVRDGTVRFTGRRGGYGLLVILDHGDGLTTWYGHASRILVAVGQQVRQGETIAAVGTTGNVTGPSVHFEVRRDNVPLDPLRFLQSR